MHFMSIANYTTWTLCIMLRKKHKKRSKGWRDHPPSWFCVYQGLFKLNGLRWQTVTRTVCPPCGVIKLREEGSRKAVCGKTARTV